MERKVLAILLSVIMMFMALRTGGIIVTEQYKSGVELRFNWDNSLAK